MAADGTDRAGNHTANAQYYMLDTLPVPNDKEIQDLALRARKILRECSPIAKQMRMMGELQVEDVRLVVDTKRPKQAPEMSIVFRTETNWEAPPSRSAVAFPLRKRDFRPANSSNGNEQFVRDDSPLWELLAYPLFFPVYNESDLPTWHPQLRSITDHAKKVSEQLYYRQRILCEPRIQQAGRLGQAYVLDGYSRMESRRMQFYRNDNRIQRRTQRCKAEKCPRLGLDPRTIFVFPPLLPLRGWALCLSSFRGKCSLLSLPICDYAPKDLISGPPPWLRWEPRSLAFCSAGGPIPALLTLPPRGPH
eukprot:gene13602-biopygen12109